jgi:hypothetical protein
MRLLAYNHYLEKTVITYLLSATWGTYVIILDVIIISEQNIIIFKVIQSALMCHCKRKIIFRY